MICFRECLPPDVGEYVLSVTVQSEIGGKVWGCFIMFEMTKQDIVNQSKMELDIELKIVQLYEVGHIPLISLPKADWKKYNVIWCPIFSECKLASLLLNEHSLARPIMKEQNTSQTLHSLQKP